jgi:hypothetical protein
MIHLSILYKIVKNLKELQYIKIKMLFSGYWTFFSCLLCNFFYNKNEENLETEKHKFSKNVETYIVKPVFYIISYTLIVIMLLLFSIIKIIKYTVEFLMDFVDKDETKLYDRLLNYKNN